MSDVNHICPNCEAMYLNESDHDQIKSIKVKGYCLKCMGFKSERWDVNELVGHGDTKQKLTALLILWRGRKNDIIDRHQKNRFTEHEIEVLEQCSKELEQVLKILFYEGDV